MNAKFWAKVEKTESCWLWTGYIYNGYGRYRHKRVHRIVYEELVGEIPEGLVLDHLCRVRNCVRPDHLEPVTNVENVRRGVKYRPYCKRGHLYVDMVRYSDGKMYRRCNICVSDRSKLYYKKHRERINDRSKRYYRERKRKSEAIS